jgi:hypothetical protein
VCRQSSGHSSCLEVSADKSASISNHAEVGHRVPLTYLCVAPPGWDRQPSLCRGTADSLPRLAHARNLKQHWQPLQVFTLSQSLFFLLFYLFSSLYLPKTAFAALANLPSEVLALQKPSLAGKNFPSPKLKPPTLQRTLCHRMPIGWPCRPLPKGCTLW